MKTKKILETLLNNTNSIDEIKDNWLDEYVALVNILDTNEYVKIVEQVEIPADTFVFRGSFYNNEPRRLYSCIIKTPETEYYYVLPIVEYRGRNNSSIVGYNENGKYINNYYEFHFSSLEAAQDSLDYFVKDFERKREALQKFIKYIKNGGLSNQAQEWFHGYIIDKYAYVAEADPVEFISPTAVLMMIHYPSKSSYTIGLFSPNFTSDYKKTQYIDYIYKITEGIYNDMSTKFAELCTKYNVPEIDTGVNTEAY